MVLVTRNPMWWLAGTAVSLIIAAVIYFAVVKPNTDSANKTVKQTEKQAQQVIDNATKQVQQATKSAGASGNGAAAAAQSATDKAAKLAACVTKAGTDVSKIQACNAQYQ
jgi:flagellar biosynthesis/type III secretory pathway M-ring protein FliF/YscJ